MNNNNLKIFVALVFSALVGLFVKNTNQETNSYKQNSSQNNVNENNEINKIILKKINLRVGRYH